MAALVDRSSPSSFAENVKWLEVNRIINVLSVGEFPFKSEKIGVKRAKRPQTDEAKTGKENGEEDQNDEEGEDGEEESNEDGAQTSNNEEEEKAREVRKEARKSLTRRIYPPHFKVPLSLH